MSTFPGRPGSPDRRRPQAMSLQGSGAGASDQAELLDPANQSLADALRITLRLVYLGVVVLFALFLMSGSQSVQESERGIRLMFGAKISDDVQPGLSWNAPYPIGELVKVHIGQKELKLQESFWVAVSSKADLTKPIDQLPKLPNLTPGQGGSNLTADGNIAHTQWTVLYARENPAVWARNVLAESEESLVRAAVKRGVVQACAKVTIEDLLKQSQGQDGSVATRARLIAQAQLDRLNTGIRIQQLLLENAMPPLFVREKFNGVQSAVSEAAKTREEARKSAQQILNAKAGEASPYIIRLIDDYEKAVEGRAGYDKNAILASINKLLVGDETTVDGVAVVGVTSGAVSQTIAEARQYRSEVASKRRAEATQYTAKLGQFKTNPEVAVAGEIADASRAFLGRPEVQLMALPQGSDVIRLILNRDPEILKGLRAAAAEEQGRKASEARMRALQEERFKPKEGSPTQQ